MIGLVNLKGGIHIVKNRKWLMGLLSSALVLSSVTPVVAGGNYSTDTVEAAESKAAEDEKKMETNISKEEAIKIADQTVKIPKGYERQNVSFHDRWGNTRGVWRISWNSTGDVHGSMDVTVDADTGDVVGLSVWQNAMDEKITFPPKVDYDKAVHIAKEYIKGLYPIKYSELTLDENYQDRYQDRNFHRGREYRIQFYQTVNDIPFPSNSMNVSVTSNGDVRSFHYNWIRNIKFEEPVNVIEKEKIAKIIENLTEMELVYLYDRHSASENKVRLAYVPKDINNQVYYYGGIFNLIDAQTGERITHEGIPEKTDNELIIPEGPLTEDATLIKVREKEITQEEAYKIIKSSFEIPEDVKLEHASYEEKWYRGDVPVWRFNWRKSNAYYHPFFMEGVVNAKTGEILEFRNEQRPYEEGTEETPVNITKEEALKKATEFVKTVAPNKTDRLYPTIPSDHYYNNKENPKFYSVYFVRKENGIPVNSQGVRVTVETDTGKIASYMNEWIDIEFPSLVNVIESDEAKKAYLYKTAVDLEYFVPVKRGEDGLQEEKIGMLVYRSKADLYQMYLDAETGEWKDIRTDKVISDNQSVTDIKGHWAEKEMQTLIDFGLLEVEDGKVNPNDELSRAEVLKLLLQSIGFDGRYYNDQADSPFKDVSKEDELYPYIKNAVDRKFIEKDKENFRPNEDSNREFLAVLIVKALGYHNLASIDGVFTAEFLDSEKITYKGHAALVKNLGIMAGNKAGYFMPDRDLTKAQAAVVLYRFLQKKAELEENRYY